MTELSPAARVLMALVGAIVLVAFLLLGAVLWVSAGDGPCDGPAIGAECVGRDG